MDAKSHWEHVYASKAPVEVSWFQPEARLSLSMIQRAAPRRDAKLIDVGGGASTLVDGLLDAGYTDITVLDLSAAALDHARRRLGERAGDITWREADILTAELPAGAFDVWHDRAVFHFLTRADDRRRYVAQVRRAVKPGGAVLVATFAEDGPTQCSGLDTARYSPAALHGEFGAGFRLIASDREQHHTPWGALQAFTYCLCRYEPTSMSSAAA